MKNNFTTCLSGSNFYFILLRYVPFKSVPPKFFHLPISDLYNAKRQRRC